MKEYFRAYHVLSCRTTLCCTPIISCYVISYHVMSYYVSTTLHHFKSYLTKLVPHHITSDETTRHPITLRHTYTLHCTALIALPLVSRCLGDGRDYQWLHACARVVRLLLAEPYIHYIAYPVYGQRCFRDICTCRIKLKLKLKFK